MPTARLSMDGALTRRRFLQAAGGAAGLWLASGRAAAPGRTGVHPQDPEAVARARERIARIRRGPGCVWVKDRQGRPVGGARVRIEQVSHAFRFGCNFFRFGRLNAPELEEEYRRRFASVFNFATLGFYWPSYERRAGEPDYDTTDRVASWCRDQGIVCKGHPLVWDFADPAWLPRDFAEIARLSHRRVREIVERFAGRIDIWDVVNEPTHLGRFNTRLGEWAISVGAVPYVREHLEIARAANPSATLLVNDYRTDPPYYRILDALRKDGRLLMDGVGIQSHMHGSGWAPNRITEVCDRFQGLGLPLHFTETTIVSGPRIGDRRWGGTTAEGEATQAEYVPQFYTMLFGHPAVEAITWWDFSDNGAWQGAAAGWVRPDMTPKPVYERMQELIRGEWWTRAVGRTGADGQWTASAYFGRQRVAVEWPGGGRQERVIDWRRGEENRVVFEEGR